MSAGRSGLCPCGDPDDHVIMRRRTADGIEVCLWDDGAVTGALGYGLRGLPLRRPKSAADVRLARIAGSLLLGEACIYDADDLGELYRAATKAAVIDGLPGTMRRLHSERRARRALPMLNWIVVSTDRDGSPTERQARLPRLRWPRMVVFDFCGGSGKRPWSLPTFPGTPGRARRRAPLRRHRLRIPSARRPVEASGGSVIAASDQAPAGPVATTA